MKNDYSKIFWFHLVLIIIAYLSWIIFSWYLVLIGIIILKISHFVSNGCIITIKQFGKEDASTTFIGYYLEKWGIIKKNTPKVKKFIRQINPIIILVLALIWQLLLKIPPIIF